MTVTQPGPNAAAPAPGAAVAPAPPDAVADLRATARWTIAATAAVGTLLIGGGPLAAVGKINDRGDVLSALGGLTLALLGISWAIWHTSEALTPRIATLASLETAEMAALKKLIENNTLAFYGPYSSLTDLRGARNLHESIAARIAAALPREQDSTRIKQLEQGLTDARANAEQARVLQDQLLSIVHAWSVRAAVRRARIHTLAAFGVVAVGAVLFLTATNDDKTATAPQPSSPQPATSIPATRTS